MKRKILSASLTAALLMSVFSNTACNLINDPGLLTSSSTESTSQTETSKTETTTTPETSETSTESKIEYKLAWSNFDSQAFDREIQKKYNGMTLASYVSLFGFTDELNKMLTGFVNDLYGRDYESVPFSEVNYFKLYITPSTASAVSGIYSDDYELFALNFLNSAYICSDPFNEVAMSYLVEKQIPFGSLIPIEDLKSFYGENVYQGTGSGYSDYICKNAVPSNKKSSYKYKKDELLYILLNYNDALNTLMISEGVFTRDFFSNDPDYEERTALIKSKLNAHFKSCYGADAWKFGEIPTEEQYEKNFGKKPLDLSYVNTPDDKDAN